MVKKRQVQQKQTGPRTATSQIESVRPSSRRDVSDFEGGFAMERWKDAKGCDGPGRDPMKPSTRCWVGVLISHPSRTGRSIAACAHEAVCEGRGAKRFYCPWRDGHFFLHHFPALRTGLLLSLRPSGTKRNSCLGHESRCCYRTIPSGRTG
jgi:hypothetical protein